MLTAERARELLSYDPESGVLSWRVSRGCVKAGAPAIGLMGDGYISLGIDGHSFLAHRVIYLMVTGNHPADQIDHRDLDRTNNRWANLRPATFSNNMVNKGIFPTNTSGFKGVDWYPKYQKWRARVSKDGKLIFLGYFDSALAAYEKYCEAARAYHGEFARVA